MEQEGNIATIPSPAIRGKRDYQCVHHRREITLAAGVAGAVAAESSTVTLHEARKEYACQNGLLRLHTDLLPYGFGTCATMEFYKRHRDKSHSDGATEVFRHSTSQPPGFQKKEMRRRVKRLVH
jgi:hypothetical protein